MFPGSLAEVPPAAGSVVASSDLVDMVCQLGAAPDLRWAAAGVVKYALELTGARWAEVVDRFHGRFRVLASTDIALSESLYASRRAESSNPPLPEERPVSDRIVIDDLAGDDRWANLAHIAADLSVRSAVLEYLVVEGHYTAGLAVYDDRIGYFSPMRVDRIHILSQIAAPLLAGAAARELADQLDVAVHTNRTIAAAVGILIHRDHLDQDTAFQVLVRASQRRNRKLHQIASEIVADPQRQPLDET